MDGSLTGTVSHLRDGTAGQVSGRQAGASTGLSFSNMAQTPEHKAAHSGIMKTLVILIAVVVALYIGSFFFLTK